ncbi:hypothetical protein Prudu_015846 [Prunus dulcis]|uniref:Uncharacterized protein n=1 Tax=Prunus dulcis TaxID=3755 RepID=A0A4Y1RK80_PRUDU|nr:hypothetical protein Prudu_015846 [Prunus dulcis]
MFRELGKRCREEKCSVLTVMKEDDKFRFMNAAGHEQFHASLGVAKQTKCLAHEPQWNLPSSPPNPQSRLSSVNTRHSLNR